MRRLIKPLKKPLKKLALQFAALLVAGASLGEPAMTIGEHGLWRLRFGEGDGDAVSARDVETNGVKGAAYKVDPTAWRVGDITRTINDPLARILRKRLRREGINHFKCVYSTELPRQVEPAEPERPGDKRPPASNAWVPAAAGLILGGEVVKDLTQCTMHNA